MVLLLSHTGAGTLYAMSSIISHRSGNTIRDVQHYLTQEQQHYTRCSALSYTGAATLNAMSSIILHRCGNTIRDVQYYLTKRDVQHYLTLERQHSARWAALSHTGAATHQYTLWPALSYTAAATLYAMSRIILHRSSNTIRDVQHYLKICIKCIDLIIY